jgi:hypothetical protein
MDQVDERVSSSVNVSAASLSVRSVANLASCCSYSTGDSIHQSFPISASNDVASGSTPDYVGLSSSFPPTPAETSKVKREELSAAGKEEGGGDDVDSLSPNADGSPVHSTDDKAGEAPDGMDTLSEDGRESVSRPFPSGRTMNSKADRRPPILSSSGTPIRTDPPPSPRPNPSHPIKTNQYPTSSPHPPNPTPSPTLKNPPMLVGTPPPPRRATTGNANQAARGRNSALMNDSLGDSVRRTRTRSSRIRVGRIRWRGLAWERWKRRRSDRQW